MRQAAELLETRGIRPTPNRVIVLDAILRAGTPVSLIELETGLDTLERSSIFRVLTLLASRNLLHAIDDGSGSTKYEVCKGHHNHSASDMHCHFHCLSCGRTFCLETIKVPEPQLPDGFTTSAINYMVKGLCPDCSKTC